MELLKLAKMLIDISIPFDIDSCLGYAQICIPDKSKSLGDIVSHPYSYGGEDGLLEIMGFDVTEEEYGDNVLGYLTAEAAFEHIRNSYRG